MNLQTAVTVDVTTANITAGIYTTCTVSFLLSAPLHSLPPDPGKDYTPISSGTLIFPVTATTGDTVCGHMTIIDADIYEEYEQFSVGINTLSPPSVVIGEISSLVYSIQDVSG